MVAVDVDIGDDDGSEGVDEGEEERYELCAGSELRLPRERAASMLAETEGS